MDNGGIRFTCHKENGTYGIGLLISNNFSLVKNKNIQLLFRSTINYDMTIREYVSHQVWGGRKHKGTDITATAYFVYSGQIIGNKINELIFNTNTDQIYDNDDLAFIFEFKNNIQEDFIFDILINDITNNINNEYNEYTLNKLKTNIGFISFDDILYSGFKNRSSIVDNNGNNDIDLGQYIIATRSHSYSYNIKFKPFTLDVSEYNNPTRLWLYGSVYVKLNNFLFSDNNYTFYIKTHKLNGDLTLNSFSRIISNDANAWKYNYSSYFNIHSNTYNNDTTIASFNTADVTKTELDSSNNYYLNLYYQMNLYPSNNEIISTYDSEFEIELLVIDNNNKNIATDLIDFNKDDYYTKSEVNSILSIPTKYITCWGDSLTAGGGWTTQLSSLSGLPVYNGGTGGETSKTICSRQGADAMVVNNITIPADTSDVLIASRTDDIGITTVEGNKVTPLLQGGSHVNPCKIGDIEGTLRWTGSNYADTSGTWVFKRSTAGDSSIIINRPTILRTNYDMNRNNPYLMIIFIGQNGGWDNDLDTLVRQNRLMIEHANAEHVIILGLSSGSATSRADYETRMKQEFGRYFISLREYLSTPIYENGEIVSCYGIEDQDAEIDMDYISPKANNLTVKQEIEQGIVPHAILADSVHYTSGTKTIIGDLIYKRCKELNIF